MIALLTAVHFHYSTLIVPVFLGLLGRAVKETRKLPRWYTPVASLFIVSPLLVAVGITYSKMIEIASVSLYVGCLYLFSIAAIMKFRTNWWIVASAAVLLFTMSLSFLYAIDMVAIPEMIQYHGWINGIGFALIGLIGYFKENPQTHFSISSSSFSKIKGEKRIGVDFFNRHG
nr:YndJ family transporter [Mesobacillus harenae]